MQETKLQIRARLLSAIMELSNPANKSSKNALKIIDSLRDIEDKEALLDILSKELKKEMGENTDDKVNVLFALMHELLEKDAVENELMKELTNPNLNDSVKSNIITVLRGFGSHINYDDYIKYLDDPEGVIDADTTRLLTNAIVNPEAQIDFLDFINALPLPEAKMLLASLSQDYDGDNLANILSPLILSKPYSELAFEAIKTLGDTRSVLALNTLEYIMKNIEDAKVQSQAQKSISMLKLSGVKENNSKKFYKEILSESPVYKCLSSLPDGHGNLGLIFSRKNDKDLIRMFAVVINDSEGVVDAFGFNEITETEFERIVTKFYSSDLIAQVSPEFCKYILKNAEKTTRHIYKEMAYEYVAWRTIINDIDYQEIDLAQGAKTSKLNIETLNYLYNAGYFDKWFLDINENFVKFAKSITDSKDDSALFQKPLPLSEIFDKQLVTTLDNRLLLMSYLMRTVKSDVGADIIYSIIYDEEIKAQLFEDMLKKSIYEYFLKIQEEYHGVKNSASIFTRKRDEETQKIDIKFIEQVIADIEKNWIK